jgi:cytochrome bd-type quinol oxidase subunit 2
MLRRTSLIRGRGPLDKKSAEETKGLTREKIMAVLIVMAHLLVVLVHGKAHSQLHIQENIWQNTFIAVVIVIGPVLAMTLLWARLRRIGFVLLSITMAGSLSFGVAYHFLVPGSDNAVELHSGHWESLFRTTAIWLAVIEAGAIIWCGWALKSDV